jgi:glutamate synthase domain-containing protein 1
MVFLPHDEALRQKLEKEFESAVAAEGQTLIGWRDVPVDPSGLGKTARNSMPLIRQIFIGRQGVKAGMDFERKLYVIRRLAEKKAVELTGGRPSISPASPPGRSSIKACSCGAA